MSERYSRLFTLPENLYAESSPVIISAGALLKDNQTGKILAQIKIKNIGNKRIKVVKVKISPMDSIGNTLGEFVEHQYLDLNEGRNEEFGQKQAIQIPDIATRKMSVSVTEVFFSDNSSWASSGENWEELSKPVTRVNDNATEQFRMDFGFNNTRAVYNISEQKDLWYCVCGALNHKEEDVCHICKNKFSLLKNIDWAELNEKANRRIAEENAKRQKAIQEENARKQKEAELKKKKVKKYAPIAAVLVVVAAFAALYVTKYFIPNYFIPNQKYKDAVALMEEGRFTLAIDRFKDLEGFKDSETMITECDYRSAVLVLDRGDYSEAVKKFEALEDYKDSKTMILECRYRNASEFMDNGDELFAYDIFIDLADYKDSAGKAKAISEKYVPKKLNEATVGDYVLFGKYEQDNDSSNGKEDIEWLVLDVNNNKLLVTSKYLLDYKQYNTSDVVLTWKDCSLREWLNNDFFKEAFSIEERGKIHTTTVNSTLKRLNLKIHHKDSCQDKVFLLSFRRY